MILSNKNDLLYDSKNFDRYRNVYAIFVNHNKIEYMKSELENCDDDLHQEYISYNFELRLFYLFQEFINLNGTYKIIFGHYYNNQNAFLYKSIHNKKVITTSVHHCKCNELLYNNEKDLICSNSYEVLKKQTNIIVKSYETKIREEYFPLSISYENKNLSIETNGTLDISFSNGCLNINNK